MIKAIFFDLFFTLVVPRYAGETEYDVIGISAAEWESFAENAVLYRERAEGKVKSGEKMIERIVREMPYKLLEEQKQLILRRWEERMKRALLEVDSQIVEVLKKLRADGMRLGLISNADSIDTKYWRESPMAQLFDVTAFSCDIGILKPDRAIYLSAMKELDTSPQESVFVGDGGSDELYGARAAGMKTVFAEHLVRKSGDERKRILAYADFRIERFDDLLILFHKETAGRG